MNKIYDKKYEIIVLINNKKLKVQCNLKYVIVATVLILIFNFYNILYTIYIKQLFKYLSLFLKVLVPLLSNEKNHDRWPKVVSEDVKRHVHNLKSNVYVVSGQAKGKTLLPLPVGAEEVDEREEIET